MKRILSLITALIFVMSLTSVFAATADWNGYFIAKYRSVESKYADQTATGTGFFSSATYNANGTQYNSYAWQKLELYPTWKLSDNVAVHAGFFSQNYWGAGRFYGYNSEYGIDSDTGSFKGNVGVTAPDANGNDQVVLANKSGQYNPYLGVSSAWATLTFLDQKLGIDIGRRLNAEWGTGVFFGGQFSPDRVFVTYKESAFGGLVIPYFIYEMRNNYSSATAADNMTQILFGGIYLKPGKTLIGLTINPNFVSAGNASVTDQFGDNNAGTLYGPALTINQGGDGVVDIMNGSKTVFWAMDLYADHKVTVNEMITVKPILEVVYATGKIYKDSTWQGVGSNAAGTASTGVNYNADVLNVLFKAEVKFTKLATVTPEYMYVKAPKSGSAKEWYGNIWGANQFCPSSYKIGLIFNNLNGGTDLYNSGAHYGAPARHYIKAKVDADILNEFVPGLNAYAAFIYAADLGYKTKNGVDIKTNSIFGGKEYNKSVVTEIDLGVTYKVDSYTTLGVAFGYAKWGDSAYNDGRGLTGFTTNAFTGTDYSASGIDKRGAKEYYFGADLTVKF